MDFGSIQGQMANQMQQQSSQKELNEAAQDLSMAARDLSSTNQNQLMQMQMQSQQTQQLSNSVRSLGNSVQQGANAAPPPPPAPTFTPMLAPVMSAASSTVKNRAEEYRQGVSNFYNTMRFGQGGTVGGQPGYLSVQNQGLMASMYHGAGFSFNPANAQNYTYGAYQRAQANNFGSNAQGYAQAGMTMGLELTGLASPFGAAGGLIGGALGAMSPIPGGALIGGEIGSRVLGQLDRFNPIAFQLEEVNRANYFGQQAEQNAYRHLRGLGGGLSRGSFSLQEQSQIGTSLARMYNSDLTYSTEDIGRFQQQFAETGQFLGVDSAQAYSQRMRQLMGNLEGMSKSLQIANEEAIKVMDQLYSNVGFDHGSEMNMMRSRLYASASLSGATPQEMIDIMTRGAGMGGQYGMLNRTGSQSLLAATSLSGVSASTNMPTSILASVGGEQGLADLIAKSNLQMGAGASGSLMALLGGNYGTNLVGAMGRGAGSISGTGDLISLMTGKHHMLDKMSPEQLQAQNTMNAIGFSNMMSDLGGTPEQRMQMYFMQQGHSAIEAEALAKAGLAQEETLRRSINVLGQERGDLAQDQMMEHNSLLNRIKLGFRETMMGDGTILDGVSSTSARVGDASARFAQSVGDSYSGFGERRLFGVGTLSAAESAVNDLRFSSNSRNQALSRYLGSGSDSSNLLRNELKSAIASGDRGRIKAAIAAAQEGGRYDSVREMRMVGEESHMLKNINEEMIQDAIRQVDASDVHHSLVSETASSSNYMTQEERVKAARGIFGGLTDVTSSELDMVISDPSFSSAVDLVEQMYDGYDPSMERQSEDWYKKQDKLSEIIAKMDPKIKQVFEKTIKDKGLRIQGTKISGFESGFSLMGDKIGEDLFTMEGQFKSQDALDFHKKKMEYYKDKKGYENQRFYKKYKKNYESLLADKKKFGSSVSDFLGRSTSSKGQEQRNTAIRRSLQSLGVDVSSLKDDASFNDNLSQIISSGLGSIDPDSVNLGNERYNEYIRKAIKFQKQGGEFTQEAGANIMKVLAASNLGGVVGETFTGEGSLGAEQLKMMQETSNTMAQTANTLKEVERAFREMR